MSNLNPNENVVLPLFRKEALDHNGHRQYGEILLTSLGSFKWLTVWFVVLALSIVAFFFLFSTTRKAQCQGVLVPASGVVRIISSQPGIVVEKKVKEGQLVKTGDVLFVLSSERSSTSANNANQAISKLMQVRRDSFGAEIKLSKAQAKQRLSTLERRVSDMSAELRKVDDQLSMQQQRVALSEQTTNRFEDLRAKNYLSAMQLQDKQAELLDQRQRLADLQRLKLTNQREMMAIQADISDLRLQSERDSAALERNVVTIDQDLTENEARREIVIRSPHDGTVTAITAENGQTVTPNVSLASVLPIDMQLEAEIYAPSRSVGFVRPGMTVYLRYQAYPYQKFGQYLSEVTEVASTSLRPDEFALPGATLPAGSGAEPLYRIRLKLNQQSVRAYGKSMPLKSGMLIDASILLEQRRLIEWVLEPLYSISGRM